MSATDWLRKLFQRPVETPPLPQPSLSDPSHPQPRNGPFLVFRPLCLECSTQMDEVQVDSRFPMSSQRIDCPKCAESHHGRYSGDTFTLSRVSVRVGDSRPSTQVLTPIATRSEPAPERGIVALLREGSELPQSERPRYFSELGIKLREFAPQEVVNYAQRGEDPERYALLKSLSSDLTQFDARQRYVIWYFLALSAKNLGKEAEAKLYAVNSLLADLGSHPNGKAWQWMGE